LGERLGEELRAIAGGTVEPAAELPGGVEEGEVVVLVDGQADGRTTGGHDSPPHWAGIRKGGSWPFLPPRLLDARSPFAFTPDSVTISICLLPGVRPFSESMFAISTGRGKAI